MTTVPSAVRTVRWMVRDTFRQSLATKLFWVMLGITLLATTFCAGVRVSGTPLTSHPAEIPMRLPANDPERKKADAAYIPTGGGEMTLGFGLFRLKTPNSRDDGVRFVQLWFAGVLADTGGVLLALLWTAGFLPAFLEPQAVTVLLAKPAPRWTLVVGKYLGVVLFVALQAVLFVGGTWLALGLATGVWHAAYWVAVPLLVVHFGVFYAVSAFLAVATRSTVVAAFGTLLFWVVCWAVNLTHHSLAAHPPENLSGAASSLLAAGYWILPKPVDLSGIFFDALGAADFSAKVPELDAFQVVGEWQPGLSVLASVLFAAGMLAIAVYEFKDMDY